MPFISSIYHRLFPYETRFYLYKLRNAKEVASLKYKIFPSSKGDFSLRHFYDNKCIFVHITKAAGTSLAMSLFGELPYHYTAQQYRVIYGKKDFNQFYKFTFVRNPWDRLYSAYSFLKEGGWNDSDSLWAEKNLGEIDDFQEFVCEWLSEEKLNSHIHLWPQSKFVCDRYNHPIVNYLGYFETIQDDFKIILNKLKLPERDLKHTNSSKRIRYTDVYTADMIDKVSHLYCQDIVNFGYSFESFSRTQVSNKRFRRVA
jgi:hypothetical protein